MPPAGTVSIQFNVSSVEARTVAGVVLLHRLGVSMAHPDSIDGIENPNRGEVRRPSKFAAAESKH